MNIGRSFQATCRIVSVLAIAASSSWGEDDRWVTDARAEWPASTGVLRKMAGDSAMVLQIGCLRGDWNSGALILVWDKDTWSFESLRIFQMSKAWGDYSAFKVNSIPLDRQKRLMHDLREMVGAFQHGVAVSDEAKALVGGTKTTAGCWVIELADKSAFRQYASNNLHGANADKVDPVVEVFEWWFRSSVSGISLKSDDALKWKDQPAPRLPIELLKVEGQ